MDTDKNSQLDFQCFTISTQKNHIQLLSLTPYLHIIYRKKQPFYKINMSKTLIQQLKHVFMYIPTSLN